MEKNFCSSDCTNDVGLQLRRASPSYCSSRATGALARLYMGWIARLWKGLKMPSQGYNCWTVLCLALLKNRRLPGRWPGEGRHRGEEWETSSSGGHTAPRGAHHSFPRYASGERGKEYILGSAYLLGEGRALRLASAGIMVRLWLGIPRRNYGEGAFYSLGSFCVSLLWLFPSAIQWSVAIQNWKPFAGAAASKSLCVHPKVTAPPARTRGSALCWAMCWEPRQPCTTPGLCCVMDKGWKMGWVSPGRQHKGHVQPARTLMGILEARKRKPVCVSGLPWLSLDLLGRPCGPRAISLGHFSYYFPRVWARLWAARWSINSI